MVWRRQWYWLTNSQPSIPHILHQIKLRPCFAHVSIVVSRLHKPSLFFVVDAHLHRYTYTKGDCKSRGNFGKHANVDRAEPRDAHMLICDLILQLQLTWRVTQQQHVHNIMAWMTFLASGIVCMYLPLFFFFFEQQRHFYHSYIHKAVRKVHIKRTKLDKIAKETTRIERKASIARHTDES